MKMFQSTGLWKMLPLLLATAVSVSLKGQVSQAKTTITYKEKIVTHFEISPTALPSIPNVDKARLKTETEERNVSTSIDRNNDVTTNIVVTRQPTNEAWIRPVSRILIDKNGATLFDSKNAVITSMPNTSEQSTDYQNLKNQGAGSDFKSAVQFRQPTATDVTNLQKSGFNAQIMQDGVLRMVKNQTEILYNNAAKQVTFNQYGDDGKLLTQRIQSYQTINGDEILVSKVEKTTEQTTNGICYTKVVTTLTTNYQRLDAAPR
ncbi:MAG: hypothetical protein J0L99_07980 [Chitinophagales bacterium]|nr:hypothetical protein [Chitinophagales bacterium]